MAWGIPGGVGFLEMIEFLRECEKRKALRIDGWRRTEWCKKGEGKDEKAILYRKGKGEVGGRLLPHLDKGGYVILRSEED